MQLEIAGVQYYLTAAILADAGISRQTFWRWRREGRIPQGNRFRNGQLLFTATEYSEILAYANRIEPEASPNTSLRKLDAVGGSNR